MPWKIKAVDAGVDENTPPHVLACRRLLDRALEAANNRKIFSEVDREFGIAVKLVWNKGNPNVLRVGRVLPPPSDEVRAVAKATGAPYLSPDELDWLYDLPLEHVGE